MHNTLIRSQWKRSKLIQTTKSDTAHDTKHRVRRTHIAESIEKSNMFEWHTYVHICCLNGGRVKHSDGYSKSDMEVAGEGQGVIKYGLSQTGWFACFVAEWVEVVFHTDRQNRNVLPSHDPIYSPAGLYAKGFAANCTYTSFVLLSPVLEREQDRNERLASCRTWNDCQCCCLPLNMRPHSFPPHTYICCSMRTFQKQEKCCKTELMKWYHNNAAFSTKK